MIYSTETKNNALRHYRDGYTIPEIAINLAIEKRTIYNWVKSENWSNPSSFNTEQLIQQRLGLLLKRENKSEPEHAEQARLLLFLENIAKYTANPEARSKGNTIEKEERKKGKKEGKCKKNDLSWIDTSELRGKFSEGLFEYQIDCWRHLDERIRFILKSRQIGMTWYFAREALVDGLLNCRDKIFISASKAQAGMFRRYICDFAQAWFSVELKGRDEITIQSPAGTVHFYFLSTNANTAQSYHGDLYLDEVFWIPRFKELHAMAMGMSSQKKWRVTLFSTPSSKMHPAYPIWSGDEYLERYKRTNKLPPVFADAKELSQHGVTGADTRWRKIITIEDAIKGGCDLFDLEDLKTIFDATTYNLLFMCQFADDAGGCFRFSDLQKCIADETLWRFFDPDADRPYAGEVLIGYDPSRKRDGAAIVVTTCPKTTKEKFYVLEKISMYNRPWERQAAEIKNLCQKYKVVFLGVDDSGPGSGVFEKVQTFYPAAKRITYTRDVKARLVLKAQAVINAHRIAWDAKYSDIASGFLAIRRQATGDDRMTYRADRTDLTGHADAAWALMHALSYEDLIDLNDECDFDDGQVCII